MKRFKKPPAPPQSDVEASGERRRIGRIRHDERGTATLEWHDAPAGQERRILKVEDSPVGKSDVLSRRGLEVLTVTGEDSFDPYQRGLAARKNPAPTKRDLRRLSEWIKMMRELEERRRREPDED